MGFLCMWHTKENSIRNSTHQERCEITKMAFVLSMCICCDTIVFNIFDKNHVDNSLYALCCEQYGYCFMHKHFRFLKYLLTLFLCEQYGYHKYDNIFLYFDVLGGYWFTCRLLLYFDSTNIGTGLYIFLLDIFYHNIG